MADETVITFAIHELKNKHLAGFLAQAGIKQIEEHASESNEETAAREAMNGRHMLITRFLDDIEDLWNLDHREELKKTGVQKLFSADDVKRYADVEDVTDDSPQPFKDRLAFVEYLEAGGAE